jgi:hypothetical protein
MLSAPSLGSKNKQYRLHLLAAKFEEAHNTLIFQNNECLKVDPVATQRKTMVLWPAKKPCSLSNWHP